LKKRASRHNRRSLSVSRPSGGASRTQDTSYDPADPTKRTIRKTTILGIFDELPHVLYWKKRASRHFHRSLSVSRSSGGASWTQDTSYDSADPTKKITITMGKNALLHKKITRFWSKRPKDGQKRLFWKQKTGLFEKSRWIFPMLPDFRRQKKVLVCFLGSLLSKFGSKTRFLENPRGVTRGTPSISRNRCFNPIVDP